MNKVAIICVDDEQTILDSLKIELEDVLGDEYLLELTESGEEALEVLSELLEDDYEIALVIADYIMPGIKGDELLKRIHAISPKTLKIMLTGHANLQAVGNAVNQAKLYRYIPKPWQREDLNLTVSEAIYSYFQEKKLEEKNEKLQQMNQQLEALNKEQSSLIYQLHEQEKHLFKLNQAYERFLPHQFLQLLNKESIVDVELGDQVNKEMSILFSDIRDFTTISEQMTPEDNFKFINSYLSRMEPAIIENHGFIDKYIGDAIMALFSGCADDAVAAGISMLHQLNEYNQTRQRPNRLPFKIGIGINTGSLMLGTVGGHYRMDTTVISDAVNLASRLEKLTKFYGVSLLISQYTFWQLQEYDNYSIRLMDRVQVKGKSKIVSVFEVFDADPPEMLQRKLATRTAFEQALTLYHLQAFREAEELFADCLHQNPQDRVTQIYLQRCQQQLPPLH